MNTTTNATAALPLCVAGLPADWVMAEPAFVAFRLRPKPDRPGKYDKLPINPHNGKFALANNAGTWGSLDTAIAGIDAYHCHGISLMLAQRWRIVAVDLDGCRDRDTATVAPWAQDIIATFAPCYWGPSVSGTGVRILVRGEISAGHNDQERGIEIYGHARQMTLTGHMGPGAIRTIEPRQDAIDAFLAEYFPAPEPQPARVPPQPIDLDDEALLFRARRNDAFDRLWRGDMTDAGDNASQADYRLAWRLLFWTQGNETRTDRLMRASGLARAKWDEARAGSLWLRRHCIAPAATRQGTYYDPLRPHQTPAFALPGGDQGTAPPTAGIPLDTAPDTAPSDLLAAYRALGHDELARLAVELHQTVSAQQHTLAAEGQRRRTATEMLSNVMQIRRNKHIKTERDTLIALALACDTAPTDDEGYARLPLSGIADAVGKGTDTVSEYLTRAQTWGLLDKKLVTDRYIDNDTGEVTLKPTTRVKLLATPAETLRTLVTIAPPPASKEGNTWGGKRVPCPHCGSARKIVSVHCADCGELLDRREIAPPPVSVKMTDTPREESWAAIMGVTPPSAAPTVAVPVSVKMPSITTDTTRGADSCIGQDDGYRKSPSAPPCANRANPLYRCDQTVATPRDEYCAACVLAGWDQPALPTPEPIPLDRLPRCLAHGCAHRVDRRGDRYCARCVGSGQGYSNAPPSPPPWDAVGAGDD